MSRWPTRGGSSRRAAAAIDDALDGDVNSIVDALHRKARGEAVEPAEAEVPQVSRFDEPAVERPNRPLRLMASTDGQSPALEPPRAANPGPRRRQELLDERGRRVRATPRA